MKKIAIYGCGSLGHEVYDLLNQQQKQPSIFIDDIISENEYKGTPVVSYEKFRMLNPMEYQVLICLGEPVCRAQIRTKLQADQIELASYISEFAYVSRDSHIAKGVIVFPNAYVSIGAYIDENTLIHANAKVEEGAQIGSDSFISLGAFVGAETVVGNTCFVGPNATVRDRIIIADETIVGMACCVVDSLSKGKYVGNPARRLMDDSQLVWEKNANRNRPL